MAQVESKFLNLKNDLKITIRSPIIEDAQQMLEAFLEIAKSSPYILSTVEDVEKLMIQDEEKYIESHLMNPNALSLIAEFENKIIGIAGITPYKAKKRQHRAVVGISVALEHRGFGLGRLLMNELLDFIKTSAQIKIVELDVMNINTNAIRLYESLGFVEVARIPQAYILDNGEVADSIIMSLRWT